MLWELKCYIKVDVTSIKKFGLYINIGKYIKHVTNEANEPGANLERPIPNSVKIKTPKLFIIFNQ